jgi:hypothetical protein
VCEARRATSDQAASPASIPADPINIKVKSGIIVVGHVDIAGAGLNIRGTWGFVR